MSETRKRTTYTWNLSNNQSITVDIGNVDNARGSVSKSTLKELPLYKIESRDVVRIISRRNEVPSALAEIRACLKESNGSNGIDYIVLDEFYIDSKNQTQGGTVDEKIPHTIFKYYEKYKQPKYYIVGYYEYKESIKRHIKFLEDKLNIKVYFYTPEEMIEVIKESGIKPLMDKFI